MLFIFICTCVLRLTHKVFNYSILWPVIYGTLGWHQGNGFLVLNQPLLLLLSRFSRVHSVRPHRPQPTRLRSPWDSPGALCYPGKAWETRAFSTNRKQGQGGALYPGSPQGPAWFQPPFPLYSSIRRRTGEGQERG